MAASSGIVATGVDLGEEERELVRRGRRKGREREGTGRQRDLRRRWSPAATPVRRRGRAAGSGISGRTRALGRGRLGRLGPRWAWQAWDGPGGPGSMGSGAGRRREAAWRLSVGRGRLHSGGWPMGGGQVAGRRWGGADSEEGEARGRWRGLGCPKWTRGVHI